MKNEILIPKLGWSIDEATFVEWHKSNGDYINSGDDIFSVESDKAIQVVESIDSGWIWIDPEVPKEGQILKFGTVIGYLSEEKTNSKANLKIDNHEDFESNQNSGQLDKEAITTIKEFDESSRTEEGDNKLYISDRIFISPRAKSIANKLNIDSFSEIKGTGKNNRITEKDIHLFHEIINHNSGGFDGINPNLFNITINCSVLLDFINSYNETERDKNLRLIDYLIKIFGHAFRDNNQNNDLNLNKICLINNDTTKESFFVCDSKNKGLEEINRFTTIPDENSIIDQSTIVLSDLTNYNIQFFNPKIIAPSLLSIGIGKLLNDRNKDLFTLNFSYLKEFESNMLNKIKLITEFTNSPYRILL